MPTHMTDLLGYTAAALVLAAFSVRSVSTLRAVAIASNLMFMLYAGAAGLAPVFLLHATLLPLNLWRLHEARGAAGASARPSRRSRVIGRTGGAVALVMLLLPGCGGDGSTTDGRGVGNAGGTVTGSGAELVVPAGALAQATAIEVTASEPAPAMPAFATLRGPIYTFTPAGTAFAVAATLTLPTAGAPAANEEAVVSWLDASAGRWVDLPSTATADRISARVEHFTVFTVRHVPRPTLRAIDRWWSFYTVDRGAPAEERLGPDAGNEFSNNARCPAAC